jgi:FecR protein
MMKSNNDFDAILEKTTAEMRNEEVDSATVNQAAKRVWARLAVEVPVQAATAAAAADRIESCNDFQSLIPAHLSGSLSDARSLLLVDHTHECIPCRKALKDARTRRMAPARRAVATRRFSISPVVLRWGIAAALIIGVGLIALPLIQRYAPLGGDLEATVQAAEGQVFQIADTRSKAVNTGDKLQKGDRLRTAKDAHAFVRLGDGSVIEVKDRSEFYITKNVQGTTIHLDRGAILVEAAKQGKQHLFVETADSHMAVTGTVFSVNNGTKGSRVSVVEGEVHFDHAGAERVLKGGEQATTSAAIEKIAVKDEVSWSKNAAKYATTLAALSSLNRELAKVQVPGVRTSTHLLDMMPENTVVYAALPNFTATLLESHRIMQDRINQNAALRAWWEQKQGGERGKNLDQVMGTIREFGDYLGDEIAVSVSMDEKGEPVAPLVLAELKNAAGFQQFLEQQVAKYSNNTQGHPQIRFVADPMSASATIGEPGKKVEELYVWIQNDLFAASPKLNQIQSLTTVVNGGGHSSFASTPFHNRVAQVYQEGAGLVVAANLERVIERAKPEILKDGGKNGESAAQRESALKQLGILNLKYFVLDQKNQNGKTHTQATVSFSEARRGIPSWLAAPAPMGSLEYISPDANVVAGFVVKDPVKLVDDLLGVIETVSPELRKTLDKQQADRGVDIRNDIAAPLGGEFAFAIDGPILPTPSWKMVFEVNDSQHLQQTLERLVAEVNKEAAKFGKGGLVWDQAEIGGRQYYTLKSTDFGMVEINYTYVNGYVVMGPSRAMVERSVRAQSQGYTLLRSTKFTAGLPADGNANFSAVFYHNLAPLVQPFAEQIASRANSLPQEQQQAIKSMAADMPPTLAYAYAQGDSITFAANTEGGPFGLSPATIMGVPNALEIQSVLQRGMKK